MGTIMRMALDELEPKKNQGGLTGVPSGFTNLDRLTSGWQPTELDYSGRPASYGKNGICGVRPAQCRRRIQ